MLSWIIILSLAFVESPLSCCGVVAAKTSTDEEEQLIPSPFRIIIDGGSTGSRLHIYEFVTTTKISNSSTFSNVTTTQLEHRGSSKVRLPLTSTLCDDNSPSCTPQSVAEHMIPLFQYASKIIDPKYHSSTPITYQATAGMRLIPTKDQKRIYDLLYEGLTSSTFFADANNDEEVVKSGTPFPFTNLKRMDFGTLPGKKEGYYGAVAANYLGGIIDSNLVLQGEEQEPIGALDMGGSSTQIVFLPKHNLVKSHGNYTDNNRGNVNLPGSDSFVAKSFLSFGVDQFRERVWDLWVSDTVMNHEGNKEKLTIHNPCSMFGYNTSYRVNYTLIGTGNSRECTRQLNRLLVTSPPEDGGTSIQLPHTVRGEFIAMSNFFFSFDAMRVLGKDSALNKMWPKPSLSELAAALPSLCDDLKWKEELHLEHKYSSEAVMPHRCFEAVYLVSLLKNVYGFNDDENTDGKRMLGFYYDLHGKEVEWTLGMALILNKNDYQQHHSQHLDCALDDAGNNSKSNGNVSNDDEISKQEHFSPTTCIDKSLQETKKY